MSKLAEDRYLVVATDTAHRHVEAWLRRHLPQQPPLPGTAGLQVRPIYTHTRPLSSPYLIGSPGTAGLQVRGIPPIPPSPSTRKTNQPSPPSPLSSLQSRCLCTT